MKWLASLLIAPALMAQMRTVALPGNSPVVTLRLVLTTGAARTLPINPGSPV